MTGVSIRLLAPDEDNPFAELERGDEAGFRMLAVAPGAQGQGSRGLAILTRPIALHAQALYDSMGFVRESERDWEFEPGEWPWAFVLRI